MSKRLAFLDIALAQEGKPYVYGSDGPNTFDCSGLVAFCLLQVAGVDWRKSHWADRMYQQLPATLSPSPGDLVFYGTRVPAGVTASHVMIVWGDGRCFGACGGDRTTLTVEEALTRSARVRFRRGLDYRPDFLGYRSLAQFFDEEKQHVKPTVGRVVLYRAHGSPDGTHPQADRAAIVTDVQSDTSISVCVLNPHGLFFNQGCQLDESGTKGGTWRWPTISKDATPKLTEPAP